MTTLISTQLIRALDGTAHAQLVSRSISTNYEFDVTFEAADVVLDGCASEEALIKAKESAEMLSSIQNTAEQELDAELARLRAALLN